MNPNQFRFSLTPRDLAEAFATGRRRARKRLLNWRMAILLVAVMGLAIGTALFNDWIAARNGPPPPAPTTAPTSSTSDVFLPLLPWIVIFAVVWFVIWRVRRGQLKNHRLIDRPHILTVLDDSITWAEPYSRVEYQWPGFFGFDESANLFIFYLSDPKAAGALSFHTVPKRAFTSEQLVEFRMLLQAKISAPIRAFPVLPAESPRL